MTASDEPLLVIDAPFGSPWWDQGIGWGLFVVMPALLALGAFHDAARRGALVWMPGELQAFFAGPDGAAAGFAGFSLVAVVPPLLLARAQRRRTGRALLYADRIVVAKADPWRSRHPLTAAAEVRVADLRGFRDRAADHVLLVPRDGVTTAVELAVPTPTEVARLTVLSTLDRLGLPRLDA